MKADFSFASLTQNRTIQKNRCQNKAHFMDDVFSKTRSIIYLNVESWFLFPPPNQNFWLRACLNTLHFYPAKTNKERVTEFLFQAVELSTPHCSIFKENEGLVQIKVTITNHDVGPDYKLY